MLLPNLPQDEKKRFLLVTLAFMCVTSAALVARTTADTLFLSHFGHQHLSYMYLGTALVVSSVAFVYGLLIGRLPVLRLTKLSIGLLIAFLIALWIGLFLPNGFIRILAYFLGDLTVHIPIMLFWTFAVFLFDPRQAKRLFGLIGAGGTVGCILIGFFIKPIALYFGTSALIGLVIALLGIFLWLVIRIYETNSDRFPSPSAKDKPHSQFQQYLQHFKTLQTRHLIGIVFVANAVLALVDYQFKAGARQNYSPTELAGFFGDFYALTSVIALIIQLFLVHHILQKGGIRLGLIVLPMGILVGSTGILLTTQYAWVIVTKVMVQIFLFTVDVAALQMLFMSISAATRNQTRAFTDGIIKPFAIAMGGIALVISMNYFSLYDLAIGSIILSLAWLVLAHTNSKAYVLALIQSLDNRRFDHTAESTPIQDQTLVTYIREALETASDQDALYLLSLIEEETEEDWTVEYRKLLQREDPEIKKRSIAYLSTYGNATDKDALAFYLNHKDPNVRSEAIKGVTKLGGEESLELIEQFLDDTYASVQAAAIISFIKHAHPPRQDIAKNRLEDLLQSVDATQRVAAAHALSAIEHPNVVPYLTTLLRDSDSKVKIATLETCQTRNDIDLLPQILPLLSDPEIGQTASDVLSSFGSKAVTPLLQNMNETRDLPVLPHVLAIPNVLATIGDPNALTGLLKATASPDNTLRQHALLSFASILKNPNVSKNFKDEAYRLIREEVTHAENRRGQIPGKEVNGTEFLSTALGHMCNEHLRNAFTILDALLPQVDIMVIFEILSSPENNNALEVLDNILPKQVKTEVVGYYEKSKRVENSRKQDLDFEQMLAKEHDIWVICGLFMAAIENRNQIRDETLVTFLDHTHPTVRETALYTVGQQNNPSLLQAQSLRLQEDPDPTVKRLALSYLKN